MSTSKRFNRTLFTAPVRAAGPEQLVEQALEEDIELILDARPAPDNALAAACAAHATYYVHRPGLVLADGPDDPAARALRAEAARLALRHRTCVLADEPDRARVAQAVAGVVGMRVLDVAASPAPLTLAALSRSH